MISQRRPGQPRAFERLDRAGAIHQAQPQAPQSRPAPTHRRERVADSAAAASAARSKRAHVLIDPRGEPLRGRAVGLGPGPVADGPGGGRQVAGLPERDGQQSQHRRVRRVGVTRVDQPLRGKRWVTLREGVLGGGHEPLDAVGARIGL